MRCVRSLSGLAGPGASLAQAGGGLVGSKDLTVGLGFVNGPYSNTDVSIDVSNWGIQAGDLLFACLFTGAWFGNDAGGLYGKTEIRQPGWTELYLDSSFARVVYKIADGSEALVTAGAVSHGGLSLIAIRGVNLPDVVTSTNVGKVSLSSVSNAKGRAQDVPVFGGTVAVDFDLLLTFACPFSYGVYQYVGMEHGGGTDVLALYSSNTDRANASILLRGGSNPDAAWWAATSSDNFQGLRAFHVGLFEG